MQKGSNLDEELRKKAASLYSLPVAFWRPVLGEDLHYHLGHFPNNSIRLKQAMELAVENLVSISSTAPNGAILDVGCGWGGPSFQLARRFGSKILGLTSSAAQVKYVNQKARREGLPVVAKECDIEIDDFSKLSNFDYFLVCESLEHISNRGLLFAKLKRLSKPESRLLLTVHCITDSMELQPYFNSYLGIQPMISLIELEELLFENGWTILAIQNRSKLTSPVWSIWEARLNRHIGTRYEIAAKRLVNAHRRVRSLYELDRVRSYQVLAIPI